jgi:hypothetical protein
MYTSHSIDLQLLNINQILALPLTVFSAAVPADSSRTVRSDNEAPSENHYIRRLALYPRGVLTTLVTAHNAQKRHPSPTTLTHLRKFPLVSI